MGDHMLYIAWTYFEHEQNNSVFRAQLKEAAV